MATIEYRTRLGDLLRRWWPDDHLSMIRPGLRWARLPHTEAGDSLIISTYVRGIVTFSGWHVRLTLGHHLAHCNAAAVLALQIRSATKANKFHFTASFPVHDVILDRRP